MNPALTQSGYIEFFEQDGAFYAIEAGNTHIVTSGSHYFAVALSIAMMHADYAKLQKRFANVDELVFCFISEYLGGFNNTPDVSHGKQSDHDGMRFEIEGHIISPREMDLIRCTNMGLADKQIADRLHIAVTTVSTIMRNLRTKIHATSKYHIIAKAAMAGIM
jgi:DNA-binding CsgD family transcriptional regulator